MAGSRMRKAASSKTFGFVAAGVSLALAVSLLVAVLTGGNPIRPGPSFVPGKARVATPRQHSAAAAGRPHTVPASVTAADAAASAATGKKIPKPPHEGTSGTRRPPVPPKGTVPAQRFNTPRSSARSGLHPPRSRPVKGFRELRLAPAHQRPKITGFDAKTSKLLPASAGRANARVFQNADGTRTADVYQHPVNFRTSSGSWAPINTNLVRVGGPGSQPSAGTASRDMSATSGSTAWQVTADSVPATFAAAGANADLAVLGFGDGHSVGFGVAGARAVTATVNGPTITYPGVQPDSDVVLAALAGGGVKESIVLHSASAPTQWVFPLDLKGVTPSLDASGRVLFKNSSGNVIAWFPHAFMTDSNLGARSDVGAYSAGVTYALQHTAGGGWELRMSVDAQWLDDPARVFPVTIDPTALWNYADSQDTFVQTGYSTTNDTSAELRIGTYDSGTDKAATYLDFSSLSSQLSHDTIYGATLYMDEIWSYSCTPEWVGVYKVTQSWNAANIANYPGPSYGSSVLGQANFAAGYTDCPNPAWESVDLGSGGTSLVQGWANGGANYGLAVLGSATNSLGWKKFDSDDAAYGLNAPYLAVTYSPYNANYSFASSPPVVSPALTYNQAGYVDVKVTNEGHDTWTPSNGYGLTYEVYESDGTTQVYATAATTSMPSNVAPGQTVTVHAKINPGIGPGNYVIKFDMIYVTSSGYALYSDWGVARTASLAITVNAIPPTLNEMYPQDNYQVDTLTPQLFADGTSVDDWPTGTLQYWFTFCAGPYLAWTWCQSSPWQPGRVFQVPASWNLTWNTDYYWTVWVQDSGGYGTQPSTPGPWYMMQTAVQQPVITSNLASGDAAGGTLDPVMGNYSSTATDASVATDGPSLAISRTYNSLDPRTNGLFGAGWSTVYDMQVTPDGGGTGSVVVTMADGTQARFALNSDGSYSPQQGMYATLTSVSGGGWQLMDKNSNVYTFNASGQLTSITDNRGRAETLSYSAGQLATITSASGRALHLTWSGAHVASVATDPVGGSPLTWTYTYSGDELTKVCSPATAPNCTTYSYTAGSHLGTAVLNTGPVDYWPLSDTSGTSAASAIGASLGGHAGTYYGSAPTLGQDAGPAAGSGLTATGFSGGTRLGLPNYTITKLGPFLTAEAWFKTTSDGVILDYQDTSVSAGNPTKWTPALYIGTDGKLRAEFWQGSMAPITSATAVNDGKWHLAVLSGDGTTQTLYLDGTEVGSPLSGTISAPVQDVTYVGDGYVSSWSGAPSGGGYFPFSGDIADVAVFDYPLGPAQVTEDWQTAQQAQELSKITLPSGRIQAQLTYNTGADRVASETDAQGGTWQLGGLSYGGTVDAPTATVQLTDPRSGQVTSVYDPLRGYQMTSQTGPVPAATTTWSYNTEGFVDGVTDPDGDATNYYLDNRGNITGTSTERTSGTWYTSWYGYYLDTSSALDPRNDRMTSSADGRSSSSTDTTYQTTYGYDSYGDLTVKHLAATPGFPSGRSDNWSYSAGTEAAVGGGTEPPGLLASSTDTGFLVTTYAYDSAGDLMTVNDPNGLVTKYTYDALGRKTSKTVVSDTYPQGVTTTYTYDALGHVLTQTGPAVPNQVTSATHTQRTTYTYDPDGNQLTATISDTTGGDSSRTTANLYNGNGELQKVTDPAGAATSYTYDPAGNVSTVTDPDGNVYAYTYTPANLVATKSLQNWTGNPANPSPPATLVLDSYSYDPAGRTASVTDSMGRTTSYTYFLDGLKATESATSALLNNSTTPVNVVLHSYSYDGGGNLTQDVANGGLTTTSYTWDADDRLQNETLDPSGLDRVTSYAWGYRDLVTSVTRTGNGSSGSQVTSYGYDNAGNVTKQTVTDGSQNLVTTYAVDELSQVTAVTDPRGNVSGGTPANYTSTMSYDAAGNLQTATKPPVQVTANGSTPASAQPVTTYGYDTFGDRTQVKDPLGNITTYGFDGDGRQTSVHDPSYTPPAGSPLSPVTTTTYDGNGNVLTTTDAAGTTTNSYDQLGDLVNVTNPAVNGVAGVSAFAYDTDGEQTAAVGPTGAQTQATYDSLGRQVTSTQVERYPSSAANVTTMAYDDAGHLVSATDPLGNTTTGSYDAAGELTKTTSPGQHVTTFGYDGFGDQVLVTNPLGGTTSTAYDQTGRVTGVTQANAAGTLTSTTSFGYDAAGNQTSVTNPDQVTSTATYDAVNDLSSATTPVTATTSDVVSYGYDAAGNRTLVTDGNGNSTVTTYNSLGLPESVVLPATSAEPSASQRTFTVSYDGMGRPVTESEPGGISQSWQYDALGDLTSMTGSGAAGSTPSQSFGYNLAGQLTSYSSPGGTVSLTYNDGGQPLSETGGGQPAQSYAYNGAGELTSRTDADGAAAFGYTPDGQLTSMTEPLTGAHVGYGYDSADELTSVTYGTGADSQALAYDGLGRVTSDTLSTSGGTAIASASYTYDAAGNVTGQATTGTAGSGTSSYTYDKAGWLTSWTAPSGSATNYSYDNAGNLTAAGATSYTYDQQDQLTASTGSAGTTSYAYAPSGTLSQVSGPSGTTSYSFNAFGQLASAAGVTYGYDALGRLTQRNATAGNMSFAYDGAQATSPAAILTSGGTLSQAYSRDPSGNLVGAESNGTPVAVLTDPLHGDVTATFTASGTTLQSSAAYDPWGNVTATSGSGLELGFQGAYTDPSTGLVDMGARWYNPASAGFTSGDTLSTVPGPGGGTAATAGDPLAGNGPGLYGYAADNPLTISDPTGHCAGALAPVCIVLPALPEIGAGVAAAGAGFLGVAALGAYCIATCTASSTLLGIPGLSGNESLNLGALRGLSGLGSLSFPDVQGIDWSAVSDLAGIDLTGINWSALAGIGPIDLGAIGGISGSSGLSPAQILQRIAAAVCGQACQQAKHVLANESVVVPKPHETPAVTQAQVNARRAAIEAKVKAQKASEDLTSLTKEFKGQEAPQSGAESAPAGTGSASAGGPDLPEEPPGGCPSEEAAPQPHGETTAGTLQEEDYPPWLRAINETKQQVENPSPGPGLAKWKLVAARLMLLFHNIVGGGGSSGPPTVPPAPPPVTGPVCPGPPS